MKEEIEKGEKMLIVEEIRKVYACRRITRDLVRFLDSLCVSERESKREGNSKNINMKRGEGRLFYNCES